MTFQSHGDLNPFEAPVAGIGQRADDLDLIDEGAEAIRREHIRHETSIKALGVLNYLGAIITALAAFFLLAVASGALPANPPPNMTPEEGRTFNGYMGGILLAFSLLNGGIGYGMRHLLGWARWALIILISIGLLNTAVQIIRVASINPDALALAVGNAIIPFLIQTYILSLVASAKGRVIFSPEYKAVIAKTPHIRTRTSPIVWILLGFLVLILCLIIGGSLISTIRR